MGSLDQFESVFNAAAKEMFRPQPVAIGRVLIVHDLEEAAQDDFLYLVKGFLAALEQDAKLEWRMFGGSDRFPVKAVLDAVEENQPDLIVTYRHLHCDAVDWPFGLGAHVDVLTQATTTPVLILPNPTRENLPGHSLKNTDRVMAVTDHLAGDHRLVSYASEFTEQGGTLYLSHVEDATVFDRYIGAISKIPDLDTDTARDQLRARLLKDPNDYVESCRAGLAVQARGVRVEGRIKLGCRLSDYRELVDENEIDLLVMYTKDEDQMAMHGVAYPLAVELRETPLLML